MVAHPARLLLLVLFAPISGESLLDDSDLLLHDILLDEVLQYDSTPSTPELDGNLRIFQKIYQFAR